MTVTATEGLEAQTNLRTIAAAWPALHTALRPGSSNALTGMPGTSPERPAPINLHISDLLHEITTEAEALAHTLMDETTWTPRTSAMPQLLLEVAEHYGHWVLADDRTAHNFCDWAFDYAEKIRRALTQPAPPKYLGPCDIPGDDGTPCTGSLYIKPGTTVSHCRTCGATVDEDDQQAKIKAASTAYLYTPSRIVSGLLVLGHDVPLKTVQRWTRSTTLVDGTIRPPKLPEVQPGLYRLTDAQALAELRAEHGRIPA